VEELLLLLPSLLLWGADEEIVAAGVGAESSFFSGASLSHSRGLFREISDVCSGADGGVVLEEDGTGEEDNVDVDIGITCGCD